MGATYSINGAGEVDMGFQKEDVFQKEDRVLNRSCLEQIVSCEMCREMCLDRLCLEQIVS